MLLNCYLSHSIFRQRNNILLVFSHPLLQSSISWFNELWRRTLSFLFTNLGFLSSSQLTPSFLTRRIGTQWLINRVEIVSRSTIKSPVNLGEGGDGDEDKGIHLQAAISFISLSLWCGMLLCCLVLNFIPFKVEWSGKWHDKFDKSRFSHHLFAGNCDPVSKNLIRLQLIRLLELIIYVLRESFKYKSLILCKQVKLQNNSSLQ